MLTPAALQQLREAMAAQQQAQQQLNLAAQHTVSLMKALGMNPAKAYNFQEDGSLVEQ